MIILPEIIKNGLYYQLESILETKTQKECVQFALNAVLDTQHLYDNEITNTCIELIEKWLIDPTTVANQQLLDITNTNYYQPACAAVKAIVSKNHDSIVYNAAGAIYVASGVYISYRDNMKFYINEAGLILKPHSIKPSPPFNLLNQQEFLIALDFIQEFYHDDLLQEQNNQIYFKFYDFLKANSLSELITTIFNNEIYKKQITRIITKLLGYTI